MDKKPVIIYICAICDSTKEEKNPCPKCGSCLTRMIVKKEDSRKVFAEDARQHGGGI